MKNRLLRARKPVNDVNLGGNITYFSAFPGMKTVDLNTWEQKTPTIDDNHNAVNETLAIDLIEEIGSIPGFYLNTKHTRKYWKKEQFIPQAADQLTYPEWIKYGRKTAIDYAKEKVDEILSSYVHTLPEEKEVELDSILEEAQKYYKKKGLI